LDCAEDRNQTAHQRTCIHKLEITHLKKQGNKYYCENDLKKLSILEEKVFNGFLYLFAYAVVNKNKENKAQKSCF
jgi:hypothetical protein